MQHIPGPQFNALYILNVLYKGGDTICLDKRKILININKEVQFTITIKGDI